MCQVPAWKLSKQNFAKNILILGLKLDQVAASKIQKVFWKSFLNFMFKITPDSPTFHYLNIDKY